MKIKMIKAVILPNLLLFAVSIYAENIDPYDDGSQYAYAANTGWLNFEPNLSEPNAGAQVSSEKITGFIWAQNIGWISLSCENTESCKIVDYGIVNDGYGNLSGYAFSANAGWISFSCENTESCKKADYRVIIDGNGVFNGWAYGQNIGWIHFGSVSPVAYKVMVCIVDLLEMSRFADEWLESGSGLAGDLDKDGIVQFDDYGILTAHWLDYRP